MGLPNIDPARLGLAVLRNISGSGQKYIDEPVLALYNMGRKLPNDPHWGLAYVNDVVGCNYRCAHCWVADDALAGKTGSGFVEKKAGQFAKAFRGRATHGADEVFGYLMKKSDGLEKRIFAFTGGETTFYRGGIRRVAELAQREKGVKIGMDTNGWLIAQDPKYLDAWDGLQDTLNLYVSIKGVTPESFRRFAGVNEVHADASFKAIETLLKRGFKAIPGGVVLNTFAHHDNPYEMIGLLHGKLSGIHPDLPRLVSYHKISTMVHDQQALSLRLRSRDYVKMRPSDFERMLVSEFEKRKTPIIDTIRGSVPGIVAKDKVLKRVISALA